MRVTREQLAVLVPGGMPGVEETAKLVSDLVVLTGEMPEVDIDACNDTLTRAARAIFCMALYIADNEGIAQVPELDKLVEQIKAERQQSSRMDPVAAQNQGLHTEEWYDAGLVVLDELRGRLTARQPPPDGQGGWR